LGGSRKIPQYFRIKTMEKGKCKYQDRRGKKIRKEKKKRWVKRETGQKGKKGENAKRRKRLPTEST